jgi:hypothetical protein
MDRLWPRVLAIGAAAILAALLLKVAHPVLVLAVFLGAMFALYLALRRVRDRERIVGTELLGLRPESADPFRISALPLALLSRTSDPSVADASAGPWRGLRVQAFGLSFRPPPVAGTTPEAGTFTCAVAELDEGRGVLIVEPRLFRASMPDPPPESAFETGDAAFDGSMSVWSADENLATAFLTPDVRAWLLSLDLRWGLEVRDRLVAVYGPKPARPDLVSTLETLRDVIDRLPADLGAARPPV